MAAKTNILTDDLKMMVDSGIITTEQAYEMMGIDNTPRSNDEREKRAAGKGSNEESPKKASGIFSFCVSPCRI